MTNLAPAVMDQAEGDGWYLVPCDLWVGAQTKAGYGALRVDGVVRFAHRHFYELALGPIPVGLELDHLCRVRHCVEPLHLEPVTHRENSIRSQSDRMVAHRAGTCMNGHPAERMYRRADGRSVYCRDCRNDKRRKS